MERRILCLLLTCFITFGSIFGQDLDYLEDMGTWSSPFSTSKSLELLPDMMYDIDYRFTLTQPMDITISNNGTTQESTCLALYNSAWEHIGSECGAFYSPPTLANLSFSCLPAGTYVIAVSWDKNQGRIYTGLKGEYPSVTRIAEHIGTLDSPFEYVDTKDTSDPSVAYQGSGRYNDGVCYCFTISHDMNIMISHCGSVVNATELYLLDERGVQIKTNFENTPPHDCANSKQAYLEMSNLAAGTYYVVSVGGYENSKFLKGNITTRITGEEVIPVPNVTEFAEEIGTFNSPFFYEDTKDTSIPGVGYPGCNDYRYGVCYRFALSRIMELTLSHCGSQAFDTHLYLLDAAGNLLADNDNYFGAEQCGNPSNAYLAMPRIAPGVYYVVSKVENGYGGIATRIMGKPIEESVGSIDRNYVMTRTYRDSLGGQWLDKVDYFDEMGRASQSVLVGASPEGGDIVSVSEYDSYGRVNKTWLPASIENKAGNYIPAASLSESVKAVYNGESAPFSHIVYELSEMNRPVMQYGTGDDWQSKGKAVCAEYQLTNIAGDSIRNCVHYQVSDGVENNDTLMTILHAGNYPTGSLQVVRKTDEDGNAVIEFSNSSGQVVLSRQIPKDGAMCYDTYYIYDEWGNLRAVLPPLAADEMNNEDGMNGAENSWTTSDPTIRNYAYLYKYDARFRLTAKRLPGQDWIRYVYDKSDALIFAQDGEQRKRGEWVFSITDGLGRECLTGICKNIFGTASLNTAVSAVRSNTMGVYKGYSVSGVTLIAPRVMTVNYYDDYAFMGKNGIPSATDSNYKYDMLAGYGERYTEGAQSLLTGTLIAQLDGSQAISYLPSVMYYDYRGRLIQSKTGTHLADGIEKEYVAYDFTGHPLKRRYVHAATGKSTQTEEYTYTYDSAGRLLTSKHILNGKPSVTLADNEYDCIGRLKANKRSGNMNLKTSYSYNVRSWVKSISNPLFSQQLYYNDKRPNETNNVCYNGNISGMDWAVSSDNVRRGYDFEYDGLSQLLNAQYLESDTRSDKFNTSYSYDKQGNILSLSRKGLIASGEYALLDDLFLTLDGNRLKAVNDVATGSAYNNGFEFKDGSHSDMEYFYDANGNLIKDLNKKISVIEYNYLNLPNRIEFEDGSFISYLYDAAGSKLRVVHSIAGNTTTTDYCGNVIYENGIPKTLLTDAGFVSLSDSRYHYYLQDHQGNNRVVADQNGNVEEVNHYYPFGGTFASTSSVQDYKYNGKELDRKGSLDWYDYGARRYDAALGRWHAADPLSEKYYSEGVYGYCGNNPVNRVDLFGMDYWSTNDTYEIARFMDAFRFNNTSIAETFNFGSWNHVTDGEFTGNLTFSDKTNTFYSSYGAVENGVSTRVGVSIKASNVWDGGASIDGGRGRWYRKASGRLENTYPEFEILMLGRGLFNWASQVVKSSSKELFNFSIRAAEHMAEKERTVPVQILQQAIKEAKGIPDPRGSKALMYTTKIWKNGRLYNLEILYDKATNAIWHFKYY